ncbi:RHS repeat-associated core domain-containing protein, partial [Sphaerisporangium flaviroseum]|uniref:RHS repeat-associated core domain-containing protein n=1 Tax=Sphaerisporangium flaviroseum TaxID=509199 RepID=UPI0031EACE3E
TNGPKRTYSYDSMDRLTGDTLKTSAGAAIASITYGYDRDDNLTTKTTTGTAGAGTNTYAYDHSNRLTSWTAPGGAVTDYAWDDSGNRTKAGTKTFTYDERNRLTSGDGTTYTYTGRGTTASETKSGVTKLLKFDAFDRMTSDGEAIYTYDGLDRVISRSQGGVLSRYLYGDLTNDLIAMTNDAGAVQSRYSRGVDGEPIGISDGTGPRFAFADQHGDVIGTFGATATSLADSVAYSPFGEETVRTGARHDLGYQGELTDPATGKVNMHARWYQPGTGTFTSRDTWTLTAVSSIRLNRYGYADANPLTQSDPTGHAPGGPTPTPWNSPECKASTVSGRTGPCDPPDTVQVNDQNYCQYLPDSPSCRQHKNNNDGDKKNNNSQNQPTRNTNGGGGGSDAPPRKPVIDCTKGPKQGYCDPRKREQREGCGKKCGYVEPFDSDGVTLNCDLWNPDPDCPVPDPDLVSCVGCSAPIKFTPSPGPPLIDVPYGSQPQPINWGQIIHDVFDFIGTHFDPPPPTLGGRCLAATSASVP